MLDKAVDHGHIFAGVGSGCAKEASTVCWKRSGGGRTAEGILVAGMTGQFHELIAAVFRSEAKIQEERWCILLCGDFAELALPGQLILRVDVVHERLAVEIVGLVASQVLDRGRGISNVTIKV